MKSIKGTVNFVELVGWLGNDPEHRYTPSGVALAEFSIGAKRPSHRNEDGSWDYDTDWIDVVAWDQLAETVVSNLRRGSRVRVTGSLKTDTWEDREGNRRKRISVRADDIMFLDARQADDASVGEASG
jgi:single-strand DNA-binding protein